MLNFHHQAIVKVAPCKYYGTGQRGTDRGTDRRAQVDPRMHPAMAWPKAGGKFTRDWQGDWTKGRQGVHGRINGQ